MKYVINDNVKLRDNVKQRVAFCLNIDLLFDDSSLMFIGIVDGVFNNFEPTVNLPMQTGKQIW